MGGNHYVHGINAKKNAEGSILGTGVIATAQNTKSMSERITNTIPSTQINVEVIKPRVTASGIIQRNKGTVVKTAQEVTRSKVIRRVQVGTLNETKQATKSKILRKPKVGKITEDDVTITPSKLAKKGKKGKVKTSAKYVKKSGLKTKSVEKRPSKLATKTRDATVSKLVRRK